MLGRVLHVSPAGYYQWMRRPTKSMSWQAADSAAFERHAHAMPCAAGYGGARPLRALSPRPQRPHTTVANPTALTAENLRLGQPAPTAPTQVWVSDSAYLPSWAGVGATWPLGAIPARGG